MPLGRRLSLTALLAGALACQAAPALAAPVNDHFANALSIPAGGGYETYDTAGATLQAGEPATSGDGHTVWFRWQPTASGGTRVKGPVWYKRIYKGTTLGSLVDVTLSKIDPDYTVYFQAKAGETYYVRIDDRKDIDGSVDPIKGTLYMTQDVTPPETSLKAPKITTPRGYFDFFSTEAGSSFACTLNNVKTPCHRFEGNAVGGDQLPPGFHVMTVQAVDPFSNIDPTPVTHTFEVDVVPPETTITSKPPSVEDDPYGPIPFTFTSTEEGSTFECKPSTYAVWQKCESGWAGLYGNGPVSLSVRATDPRGNVDPTPAVVSWTRDVERTRIIRLQRAGLIPMPSGPSAPPAPPAAPRQTVPSRPSVPPAQSCLPGLLPPGSASRTAVTRRGMKVTLRAFRTTCPTELRVWAARTRIFRRAVSLAPNTTRSVIVRPASRTRRALRRTTNLTVEIVARDGARSQTTVRLR